MSLREQVGIPNDLRALDIGDTESQRIGAMAAQDPTAATNPIPLSAEQYAAIFRRACAGELKTT